MTSQSVALNHIPSGSQATVISLHHEAKITRRLLELGVTPGTNITVLGKAPLGDPMFVRTRDRQIAIRKAEAEQISVVKEGVWTMSKIPAGQRVRVAAVRPNTEITSRLLELGLTKGSTIRVTGAAPLGDPMTVAIRGASLRFAGTFPRSSAQHRRRSSQISGTTTSREFFTTPFTITRVRSERIDRFATHKWLGFPIFLIVMYVVFKIVFTIGAPFMDMIDTIFGSLRMGRRSSGCGRCS